MQGRAVHPQADVFRLAAALNQLKPLWKEDFMPIETVSPEFDRIVSRDQDVEELGNGYLIAEGPLWWKEEGYLLFNEVRGNSGNESYRG